MPQYKVSVAMNAYIDAESPEIAGLFAQDALTALIENDSRAVAEFEMRYPQEPYPGFLISNVSVEDDSIEASEITEAVSQEELDKPAEVV
jgi:hypothetical protein